MKATVSYTYQDTGKFLNTGESDICIMPNASVPHTNETCKIIVRKNDNSTDKIVEELKNRELYPNEIKNFKVFYVTKDFKEVLNILKSKGFQINYDF